MHPWKWVPGRPLPRQAKAAIVLVSCFYIFSLVRIYHLKWKRSAGDGWAVVHQGYVFACHSGKGLGSRATVLGLGSSSACRIV